MMSDRAAWIVAGLAGMVVFGRLTAYADPSFALVGWLGVLLLGGFALLALTQWRVTMRPMNDLWFGAILASVVIALALGLSGSLLGDPRLRVASGMISVAVMIVITVFVWRR